MHPLRWLRPVGLELVFGIWVLVVAIGFLLHPEDPSYALTRIVEFKWVLILYVMFEVMQVAQPGRRIFLLVFLLGLVISSLSLFLYFADFPIFQPWRYGFGPQELLRVGGLFTNPMTFAHSFVVFFCFLLGLALFDYQSWTGGQKILAGVTLLLAVWALYLSFTRGVWIGLCLALIFGVAFWKPRHLASIILAFVVGIGSLYHFSGEFRSRVNRTIGEMNGASERKDIWRAHLEVFRENPIFGAGYGQNSRDLPRVYEKLGIDPHTLVSHAHNQYLHLAAGTGILGLLCYLVIWFFFLRQCFMLWKHQQLDRWDRGVVWGITVGLIAFLIGGLTEANFEHSKVRFMVMLAWAYVIYLSRKYQEIGTRR